MLRDLLKALLKEKKKTRTELARLIGVQPYNVSDWTRGRSKPSAEMTFKIAKALNVSLSRLDETKESVNRAVPGADTSLPPHETNISGLQPVDIVWIQVLEGLPRGVPLEDVTAFEEEPISVEKEVVKGRVFALRVKSDQMAKEIRPGDAVVIDQDAEYQDGDIVVSRNDKADGFSIGRFSRSGKNIVLAFDNPAYPPLVFSQSDRHSKIIGKMVQLNRKY